MVLAQDTRIQILRSHCDGADEESDSLSCPREMMMMRSARSPGGSAANSGDRKSRLPMSDCCCRQRSGARRSSRLLFTAGTRPGCCAVRRPGSRRKGRKYHECKNKGSARGLATGFTISQSVPRADRVNCYSPRPSALGRKRDRQQLADSSS